VFKSAISLRHNLLKHLKIH